MKNLAWSFKWSWLIGLGFGLLMYLIFVFHDINASILFCLVPGMFTMLSLIGIVVSAVVFNRGPIWFGTAGVIANLFTLYFALTTLLIKGMGFSAQMRIGPACAAVILALICVAMAPRMYKTIAAN